MGISNAGANRFNLVFSGISSEYPLITERAETVLKIKETMSTAGWDCLLERKLPDADEHACSVVPLATKPLLTESGGYSKKEVDQRAEERAALQASNDKKQALREQMLATLLHSFGTALLAAWKTNAPMMVKKLRTDHTGASGQPYGAGKLDGVAILAAFEAARAQGDESRQDKCAERKLKGIEGRLPNNVTETQFSKHCNDFITYAVPYLEREMKPKLQVQWILDALPENCAGDGRGIVCATRAGESTVGWRVPCGVA